MQNASFLFKLNNKKVPHRALFIITAKFLNTALNKNVLELKSQRSTWIAKENVFIIHHKKESMT
jgi:hypothetical protein